MVSPVEQRWPDPHGQSVSIVQVSWHLPSTPGAAPTQRRPTLQGLHAGVTVALVTSPSHAELTPDGDAQIGPGKGVFGGRQWMPLQNRSAGHGSFGYPVGHTEPSDRPRFVHLPAMQDAPSTQRPLVAHAFVEHADPSGTGVRHSPAQPSTVPDGHDGHPGGTVGPQVGASDMMPRMATTRVPPVREMRWFMHTTVALLQHKKQHHQS